MSIFNFDKSDREIDDIDWHYRNAFTIDPSQVDDAMELLGADECSLMFAMWPKLMHDSMIETLMERKSLERIR